MPLDHFHQAQSQAGSGYATALAEIRSGHKRSHWIWYVFPQIEGLGNSTMARTYALRGLDEACDYLGDPVLRERYEEITGTVAGQLKQGGRVESLMGSSIDAQKLCSSLTLFREAAFHREGRNSALGRLCGEILEETARQGYPECKTTLGKL